MPRPGSRRAEALLRRLGLSHEALLSMRFAINVAIAGTLVWSTLRYLGDTHPIWAIASMVASSDPRPEEARRLFRARLINVAVGCASGLTILLVVGPSDWVVPIGLAATVLISANVVRVTTMWRQAPITAALILTAGAMHGTTAAGIADGLRKVAEVAFGSLTGMVVSMLMSRVWLIQKAPEQV